MRNTLKWKESKRKLELLKKNTKEYESKLQKGRERKKVARTLKRKQLYMLK